MVNPNARAKRSPVACEHCHHRKVRCDMAVHGNPCTNCRLDNVDCNARAPKIRTRRRRQLHVPNATRNRPSQLPTGVVTNPIVASHHGDNDPLLVWDGELDSKSPSEQSRHNNSQSIESLPFSYYAFLDGSRLGCLEERDIQSLESQGCFHLPTGLVLEKLINHYFLYVHPCLPLIDEAKFWRMYQQPQKYKGQFSLLLFQSMLSAAAPFIPIHVAKQCGFSSLIAIRDDFYRKAKILYEHNLEDDHVVIAQTAILLSFYNSNSDAMSNSTWLSVAVEHAQAVNALEYDYIEPRFNREQLKRLWCCCILRDRVISLGMRRPLQILPDKFPVTENLMCLDDLKEELGNSKTYNVETKTMLNFMFIGLCEFAEAVTDLLLILYPPHQRSPWATSDRHGTIWEHLTRIKLRLSVWEGDFMRRLEHDECEIHPSITLFVSMIDMYYQAARIALCNHACRLAAKFESLQSKKLILESYKSELQNAVTDMADSVRRLIVADMAKYLPVSAMACTMLPLILCGLDVSLPSSARTPRRNSQKLLIFKEINRIYSLRYNVKRLSLLIERAIEFVKSEIIKIMLGAKEVVISFADMFEREPDSYVGLCLYVDRLLAVDDLGTQINAHKPNRAQQQHQKQLLDLHHYIKSEQPCLAPTSYATTSSSQDSDEGDSTIEDPSQIIPFASAMYSSASPSFSSPEYMGITVTEQIDTTPMCWASEDQNILKEHSLEQSQGQTLGGAWSDQYFETIGFLGE